MSKIWDDFLKNKNTKGISLTKAYEYLIEATSGLGRDGMGSSSFEEERQTITGNVGKLMAIKKKREEIDRIIQKNGDDNTYFLTEEELDQKWKEGTNVGNNIFGTNGITLQKDLTYQGDTDEHGTKSYAKEINGIPTGYSESFHNLFDITNWEAHQVEHKGTLSKYAHPRLRKTLSHVNVLIPVKANTSIEDTEYSETVWGYGDQNGDFYFKYQNGQYQDIIKISGKYIIRKSYLPTEWREGGGENNKEPNAQTLITETTSQEVATWKLTSDEEGTIVSEAWREVGYIFAINGSIDRIIKEIGTRAGPYTAADARFVLRLSAKIISISEMSDGKTNRFNLTPSDPNYICQYDAKDGFPFTKFGNYRDINYKNLNDDNTKKQMGLIPLDTNGNSNDWYSIGEDQFYYNLSLIQTTPNGKSQIAAGDARKILRYSAKLENADINFASVIEELMIQLSFLSYIDGDEVLPLPQKLIENTIKYFKKRFSELCLVETASSVISEMLLQLQLSFVQLKIEPRIPILGAAFSYNSTGTPTTTENSSWEPFTGEEYNNYELLGGDKSNFNIYHYKKPDEDPFGTKFFDNTLAFFSKPSTSGAGTHKYEDFIGLDCNKTGVIDGYGQTKILTGMNSAPGTIHWDYDEATNKREPLKDSNNPNVRAQLLKFKKIGNTDEEPVDTHYYTTEGNYPYGKSIENDEFVLQVYKFFPQHIFAQEIIENSDGTFKNGSQDLGVENIFLQMPQDTDNGIDLFKYLTNSST